MTKTTKKQTETAVPQDAERLRDVILRRMLNTPPKPKKGKAADAKQNKPAPRQPKG